MTTTTTTKAATAALKRKFNHYYVFVNILNAINESLGKGTEYNLGLIDDPGATIAKIITKTHLNYPQTKRYLQLLADQGLVTVSTYQRKRARKNGRVIKRQSTVTTVKITDRGYKYLKEESLS